MVGSEPTNLPESGLIPWLTLLPEVRLSDRVVKLDSRKFPQAPEMALAGFERLLFLSSASVLDQSRYSYV